MSYLLSVVDNSRYRDSLMAPAAEVAARSGHLGLHEPFLRVVVGAVQEALILVGMEGPEDGAGRLGVRGLNFCPAAHKGLALRAVGEVESFHSQCSFSGKHSGTFKGEEHQLLLTETLQPTQEQERFRNLSTETPESSDLETANMFMSTSKRHSTELENSMKASISLPKD